jgi:hypothetical protein
MAVETLRPNASGEVINLDAVGGSNWECVDEAAPDDDATYVYTNNTGFTKDLYNLPASTGSGSINHIKVYFRARGYGSFGGTEGYATIRTHGSDYNGATQSIPTSYTTYSHQWANNPYTNQPWTWSEIDALQIGTVGRQTTAKGNQYRCTQVYVEIEYTPPEGMPGLNPAAMAQMMGL